MIIQKVPKLSTKIVQKNQKLSKKIQNCPKKSKITYFFKYFGLFWIKSKKSKKNAMNMIIQKVPKGSKMIQNCPKKFLNNNKYSKIFSISNAAAAAAPQILWIF
jgi:hypothetical protein